MVIGLFISCSKDDDENNVENDTLIGKWELVENLSDPGDGSGVFEVVESDKTIEFFADSTVVSNGSLCYNNIEADGESSGTYTETEISSDDCESVGIPISFEWMDDTLIISYPCFEACQAKYSKVP